MTGYRINSMGVVKESEDNAITGFIPFGYGDVAYLKNVFETGSGTDNIGGYDAEKNFLTNAVRYVDESYGTISVDENGVYKFDPAAVTSGAS